MVLSTNQKSKHVKKPVEDNFPLAKLVTLIGISRLSSFLDMQQINSFAFFVLAMFSSENKANPALPILSQTKAAAFIPANLLKFWQIRSVPTPTSTLKNPQE